LAYTARATGIRNANRSEITIRMVELCDAFDAWRLVRVVLEERQRELECASFSLRYCKSDRVEECEYEMFEAF
jgi:hypothetical protein